MALIICSFCFIFPFSFLVILAISFFSWHLLFPCFLFLQCYSCVLICHIVNINFFQGYVKVTVMVLGPGDEAPVSRLWYLDYCWIVCVIQTLFLIGFYTYQPFLSDLSGVGTFGDFQRWPRDVTHISSTCPVLWCVWNPSCLIQAHTIQPFLD